MYDYDYNIDWSPYLKLDVNSPSGLAWATTRRQFKEGTPAGAIRQNKDKTPSGWEVTVLGKCYRVHRIIFVLVHGCIDNTLPVNHIDTNPLNNAISNLEQCTHQANNQRCGYHIGTKLSKSNSSGKNGIHEWNHGGHQYAVAQWNTLQSKRRAKYFSYLKLGKEEAWKEAEQFLKEKMKELNTQGAGYRLKGVP